MAPVRTASVTTACYRLKGSGILDDLRAVADTGIWARIPDAELAHGI